MSEKTEHTDSQRGHETRDANFKNVVFSGVGLLGLMVAGLIVSFIVLLLYKNRTVATSASAGAAPPARSSRASGRDEGFGRFDIDDVQQDWRRFRICARSGEARNGNACQKRAPGTDRTLMKCTLFIVSLVFAAAACGQQQSTPSQIFTDVGIDQHLDQQIPLELKFTDERGTPVTLGDYFHSKPVVLSLVYYRCPMLCTQVLNGMVETFNIMKFSAGNEFDVVTVSIDPSETPDLAAKKKAEYVSEYRRSGIENGWHFLTGDQASIRKLADAVGFRYVYDPKSKQFAHASGIMIATPEGKLARYLYGIEYVAKDMTFSLMEAAKGRIGSPGRSFSSCVTLMIPRQGPIALWSRIFFAGPAR